MNKRFTVFQIKICLLLFKFYQSYRHYPSNLTIIDWLGAHFVELRLTNKAVTYFEKASLIQPDEPKWRLLVGSCHRRAGNYQLALQIYKETLNKFPDNLECKHLVDFTIRIRFTSFAVLQCFLHCNGFDLI